MSGNKLSCLPLQLTLRGKSTTQSYRTPIYFVDLTLSDGVTLKDAVQQAKAIDHELSEHGFDQGALEQAAKQGYANSCFEVDDEASELMEELYPDEAGLTSQPQVQKQKQVPNGLDTHNVTSIEQGLRESVTTVS